MSTAAVKVDIYSSITAYVSLRSAIILCVNEACTAVA